MLPFFWSIASIGRANIASMPGNITRTRTWLSSTPIWAVNGLAERVDGEVELVAEPSVNRPGRTARNMILELMDIVGDAPPGLFAAKLVRQVDLDGLLHWPTVGSRSPLFKLRRPFSASQPQAPMLR